MFKKFFVSKSGNDANDGLSWNTAKSSIPNALISSESGDTIIVGPGTFDAGYEIIIDKGVTIKAYKGISDTILTRAGPTDYRILSIIHPYARVEGFTISNGKTVDGFEGGNVFINNDGVLVDCIITGGSGWQYGGNVYIEQGTVKRCEVSHGVLRYTDGGGTPVGCGGGIYIRNKSIVDSCYLHHNIAPAGAGICIHQPTSTPIVNEDSVIRNCTMTLNVSTGWFGIHGSGFAIVYQGSATNCVSWGNSPNDAAFVFLSPLVASNQSYNDIGIQQVYNGSAPSGSGNINTDPLLQNDGSLGLGSPCIGAGSNAKECKDVMRNTRINIVRPDMGAKVYL